jgi:ubiquinone/menaquinone biosynthesis C-methylase UbiE
MIINVWVKPKQHILIPEIPDGTVLDIGGGGEGVIAQVGIERVFAIDKLMSEIREARGKAADAQWMVTDGTMLPIANENLDNATAFFSCMYMSEEVKQKVFQETRRVLKDSGELWVWGANMTPKGKVFTIRIQAEIPENRSINTVYGVKAKDQSAATICAQLEKAGFEAEIISNHRQWFFVKGKRT